MRVADIPRLLETLHESGITLNFCTHGVIVTHATSKVLATLDYASLERVSITQAAAWVHSVVERNLSPNREGL